MKSNKKAKDVILAIAVTFISLILYHLAGKVIQAAVTDDYLSAFLSEVVFAVLVAASVILLRKKEIFKSDRALLKSGWKSAGFFFFLTIVIGVMGLGNLLEANVSFTQFLLVVGLVVLVGFCEETLFRGLVQRAFHNYFGEDSRKHVWMAVICSGLIFGLAHLVNLDRGNPFLASVLQAGVNCFAGMLYAAVFFRTGKNLYFMIFIHTLYDYAVMVANGRLNGQTLNNVLNPAGGDLTIGKVAVGIAVWGLIYLIPTLIVLRPKKMDPLLSNDR